MTDSTMVGNSVIGAANGGLELGGVSTVLAGDILADNQRNCSGSTPTDDGYDIDDDGTCTFSGTGSVSHSTTIDGYLGSLASNGGPTQTVALTSGAGNPARAVIPANFTAPGQTTPVCSQSDQRGLLRQAPCDMGAYGLTLATVAGPPVSLGATPVNGQIDLAWSAPASTGGTPVTGYQIFRGTTSGGEGATPVGTTTGATTWNDTSPTAGTRYYYTVRAVNAVGTSTPSTEATAAVPVPTPAPTPSPATGYWLVGGDGGIFSFGPAFYGSTGNLRLNQPVTAMASTPDGKGYWFVARDGGVFAYGDAAFRGSVPGLGEHVSDIVGIAADPATGGYWLVGADGGVYAFGASFEGSLPGLGQRTSAVVGMAATPDGGGYYEVASTGAVFAFGDPRYQGGANALAHPVNAPIVGIGVDAATGGYWLAGADGGVYAYGAPFDGSAGAEHLAQPVVGIAATPTGSGYWLVAADGGIFSYGSAPFLGSTGGTHLNAPVVGMAATG
jgi:hypothetical protein